MDISSGPGEIMSIADAKTVTDTEMQETLVSSFFPFILHSNHQGLRWPSWKVSCYLDVSRMLGYYTINTSVESVELNYGVPLLVAIFQSIFFASSYPLWIVCFAQSRGCPKYLLREKKETLFPHDFPNDLASV